MWATARARWSAPARGWWRSSRNGCSTPSSREACPPPSRSCPWRPAPAPGRAALARVAVAPDGLVARLRLRRCAWAPRRASRRVRWDAEETVEVTTLDALIAIHGLPRFVKIDVEGFEAEVLAGLARPVPWVAFEYLPAAPETATACIARLGELGVLRLQLREGRGPDLRAARLARRHRHRPGAGAAWRSRQVVRATSTPGWRPSPTERGRMRSAVAAGLTAVLVLHLAPRPAQPPRRASRPRRSSAFQLELPLLVLLPCSPSPPGRWPRRDHPRSHRPRRPEAGRRSAPPSPSPPVQPVLDGDLPAAAWRLSSGALGWPARRCVAALARRRRAPRARGLAVGRPAGSPRCPAPSRHRPALAVAGRAAAAAFVVVDAAAGRFDPRASRQHRLRLGALRDGQRARRPRPLPRRCGRGPLCDGAGRTAILPALQRPDVFLVFVESYGRSVLENPDSTRPPSPRCSTRRRRSWPRRASRCARAI